eukprot:1391407-Pyramimonas_sp.AAC.1
MTLPPCCGRACISSLNDARLQQVSFNSWFWTAHICIGNCVRPGTMRTILLISMNRADVTEMVQSSRFKGVN